MHDWVGRTRITIKRPIGQRRTYSLILDRISPSKRTQTKIKSEIINSINARLLNNEIAHDVAYQLILIEKERLSTQLNIDDTTSTIINGDNKKLGDKYIRIVEDKELDELTIYNISVDVKRILFMMGNNSLSSTPRSKISQFVKDLNYADSTKNKLIAVLNNLLRLAGRDISIKTIKSIHEQISYINESELKQLLGNIALLRHPLKDLVYNACIIMFYTGLRSGELFALNEQSIGVGNSLKIQTQITRGLKTKRPKNNKARSVVIIKQSEKAIKEWIKTPLKQRLELRESLTKIIKSCAVNTFPDDSSKHISSHDLRHSFAVWALGRGLSLSDISMILGNSLIVCQQYYTGFVMSDEGLNRVGSVLGD